EALPLSETGSSVKLRTMRRFLTTSSNSMIPPVGWGRYPSGCRRATVMARHAGYWRELSLSVRLTCPIFDLVEDGHQPSTPPTQLVRHLARERRRLRSRHHTVVDQHGQPLRQYLPRHARQAPLQLPEAFRPGREVPEHERGPAVSEHRGDLFHRTRRRMSRCWSLPLEAARDPCALQGTGFHLGTPETR